MKKCIKKLQINDRILMEYKKAEVIGISNKIPYLNINIYIHNSTNILNHKFPFAVWLDQYISCYRYDFTKIIKPHQPEYEKCFDAQLNENQYHYIVGSKMFTYTTSANQFGNWTIIR
jgi:hypothetical protein